MSHNHTPLALIILDGWGYREDPTYNAIASAHTPHWNDWWKHYPHTLIDASGISVGLPPGQMGNSEVGHMHMGAGRLLPQDFTRINETIERRELKNNRALNSAIRYARKNKSSIHLLGLLSPGGVHSHENQLLAVCQEISNQGIDQLYVHAFLDGRDTPPRSAEKSLKLFQSFKIASLIGRYYAMDRDQRWERTRIAYDLLCGAPVPFTASDPLAALHQAYERGEDDEFVQATRILPAHVINDQDVVIFLNFRADRARQLSHSLIDKEFSHFPRYRSYKNLYFVTLTDYAGGIQSHVMFPPQSSENSLGEYLSQLRFRQLRIAETEKYPHVTYFFNGGREKPFANEERILIPSPKVATYNLQPQMSAPEVTDALIKVIESRQIDMIICNFANADMVGHTGDFNATVKAVECIDECLGKIANALQQVNGEMIITADHGNAEKMYDCKTHQPFTAHTSERVPFIYVGRQAKITHEQGTLVDVAPTVLYVLGLEKPREMTGKSLLDLIPSPSGRGLG